MHWQERDSLADGEVGLECLFPTHYAIFINGFPIGFLRNERFAARRSPFLIFFTIVVDAFSWKLASWKKDYLLMGGRLALSRAFMANLSVYHLSLFPKSIEKIPRCFLWERGPNNKASHLVKWEKVS